MLIREFSDVATHNVYMPIPEFSDVATHTCQYQNSLVHTHNADEFSDVATHIYMPIPEFSDVHTHNADTDVHTHTNTGVL